MIRNIIIEPLAEDAIIALCDFVESKNTKGSGSRFYEKLLSFIESFASLSRIKFPLCRNKKFAARQWSCITFQHKWIIAFSCNKSTVVIHRLVLGSRLR